MENSLKLSLESTVMCFRPIVGRKDILLGRVTNLIVSAEIRHPTLFHCSIKTNLNVREEGIKGNLQISDLQGLQSSCLNGLLYGADLLSLVPSTKGNVFALCCCGDYPSVLFHDSVGNCVLFRFIFC